MGGVIDKSGMGSMRRLQLLGLALFLGLGLQFARAETFVSVEKGSVTLRNEAGDAIVSAGRSGHLLPKQKPGVGAHEILNLLSNETAGLMLYENFARLRKSSSRFPFEQFSMQAEGHEFIEQLLLRKAVHFPAFFHPARLMDSRRVPSEAAFAFDFFKGKVAFAWGANGKSVTIGKILIRDREDAELAFKRWTSELAQNLGYQKSEVVERIGTFELSYRKREEGKQVRTLGYVMLSEHVAFGSNLDELRNITRAAAFGAKHSLGHDPYFLAFQKRHRSSVKTRLAIHSFMYVRPKGSRTKVSRNSRNPLAKMVRDLNKAGVVFACGHSTPSKNGVRSTLLFGHPLLGVYGTTLNVPRQARVLSRNIVQRFAPPEVPILLRTRKATELAQVFRRVVRAQHKLNAGTPNALIIRKLLPLLDQVGGEGLLAITFGSLFFRGEADLLFVLEVKDGAMVDDLMRAALGKKAAQLFSRKIRGVPVAVRVGPDSKWNIALDKKKGVVLVANGMLVLKQAIDRAYTENAEHLASKKELDPWLKENDLALFVDVPLLIKKAHPLLKGLQALGSLKEVPELPSLESFKSFSPMLGGLSLHQDGLKMVVDHPFSISPAWEILLMKFEKSNGRLIENRETIRDGVPLHVIPNIKDNMVTVDGIQILLRAPKHSDKGGMVGQDPQKRFSVRLDKNGVIEVVDNQQPRFSKRGRFGGWVHRFGGNRLTVLPDGRVSLVSKDGKVVRAGGMLTAQVNKHNWTLGVRLKKAVPGAFRMIVSSVDEGSPAQKAGLRAGDEILSIGSQSQLTKKIVVKILREAQSGDSIQIKVKRAGKVVAVEATSGEWD